VNKHPKNVKSLISLPDKKGQSKRDIETIDDLELVKRFKKGNESAFTGIVNRYQRRLLQTAKVILNDEDDALDITQEAFVKAYFNLKSFREDSSLYTWLYRILYNLCISHLRRKKIISFISFDHHDEVMEFHSDEPGPEKTYERKELMQAVTKAVDVLPLKQEGLKHGEIAEVMGITEGAVKASYFHAIRKLQETLKNYGEQYGLQ
jgi:RNA polymerase sigma-70 factor, ECF subfamily